MGVSLKYNLQEYTQALHKITNLKDTIETNRARMLKSLETLRSDWTTEGGVTFFNSVDENWSAGIEHCIVVLEDLIDALDKAYEKYAKIEPEANAKLKTF